MKQSGSPSQKPISSEQVTISYIYDFLYRVKEDNYSTGDYLAQSAKSRMVMVPYSCDIASALWNVMSSVGGVTYTYDGNGNLTSDGTNTYTYDATNQLSTVASGQSIVASFGYNG